MCDTFIALPPATRSGNTILGKNSDREPDEAQAIIHVPRFHHANGQRVRCTYIDIPQSSETNACILSKPFHMWGAEMGVNEWGVAIGNEAVFTRIRHKKKNDGLTGMDLLRLALERSRSTDEAVDVITCLLEEYGQDACGGYRNRSFFYDNSFIVADPTTAWILETAGREWVAQPVKEIGSISNRLTLASGERISRQAGAGQGQRLVGWPIAITLCPGLLRQVLYLAGPRCTATILYVPNLPFATRSDHGRQCPANPADTQPR